jgi:hypothetical protein
VLIPISLRLQDCSACPELFAVRVYPFAEARPSADERALSRHTLELRPLIVTFLLTIADLRRAPSAGEIFSIAEG